MDRPRPVRALRKRIRGYLDKEVFKLLNQYAELPLESDRSAGRRQEPPYERQFPARVIYRLRRRSALVNNAIEEKVNQTFRRGFAEWEKAYEAKCEECDAEFGSEEPFRELVGDTIPEDAEIDFSTERECPECGEMATFDEPEEAELRAYKDFFARANFREEDTAIDLEPGPHSSVSQPLRDVLREVAFDIESFDNGWLLYEREYDLTEEGQIADYQLRGVHRAPPERMRYAHTEGQLGGEYWVCLECRRQEGEDYTPEDEPARCPECGNVTYEAWAYALSSAQGDPVRYFIRGEFAHASLYEPDRLYGYPPIMSIYEEAQALEKMDQWYKEAYDKRRAPRGALAVDAGQSESVRSWNKKQMSKLREDPNHIPTLMNDGENSGEPIAFVELLEDPASMQHMEMREWFLDRISAKWGVTASFQKASGGDSGLSQTMEVEVSNRAADRLRRVMQESFLKPILHQLGAEAWTTDIAKPEEEDETAQADLINKRLQNAQLAAQLGLEVEWTKEGKPKIESGEVESEEPGEEDGMGMMGGLMGDEGPGGGDGNGPVPGDGEAAGGPPGPPDRPAFDDQGGQPDRPPDPTGRGDGP